MSSIVRTRICGKMPARATILACLFALAGSLSQTVRAADCPCGYLDQGTGQLWTDAIITYFNETGASNDVVLQPAVSPSSNGEGVAGDTGTGQQAWAVVGNSIDNWEEAFGATYRSAVRRNNTEVDSQNGVLSMAVSPAQMQERIVWGAQLVSRRRDILYGSFRASLNVTLGNGGGTAFQMAARYNQSETVDLGLYMTDDNADADLRWAYSSRGNDADPIKTNLSTLEYLSGANGYLEHRFDWTPGYMSWSNANLNTSVASLLTPKKKDGVNVPSTPVPFSFDHWSNGDPTASTGPPHNVDHFATVRYVRLFFNSSRADREQEFAQQCTAGIVPVCSTDDTTLRGSTTFNLAALQHVEPAKFHKEAPLYAKIILAITGSIIAAVLIHGFILLLIAKHKRRRAQAVPAEDAQETEAVASEVARPRTPSNAMVVHAESDGDDTSTLHSEGASPRKWNLSGRSSPAKPSLNCVESGVTSIPRSRSSAWDVATLLNHQTQDSDSDSDDGEFEDAFMVQTDKSGRSRSATTMASVGRIILRSLDMTRTTIICETVTRCSCRRSCHSLALIGQQLPATTHRARDTPHHVPSKVDRHSVVTSNWITHIRCSRQCPTSEVTSRTTGSLRGRRMARPATTSQRWAQPLRRLCTSSKHGSPCHCRSKTARGTRIPCTLSAKMAVRSHGGLILQPPRLLRSDLFAFRHMLSRSTSRFGSVVARTTKASPRRMASRTASASGSAMPLRCARPRPRPRSSPPLPSESGGARCCLGFSCRKGSKSSQPPASNGLTISRGCAALPAFWSASITSA